MLDFSNDDQQDHHRCTFCSGRRMVSVIDFGDVALAGGFLKPNGFAAERKYRLHLFFCEDCFAVQLGEFVDPKTLFGEYFYSSSAIATLREHFYDFAAEVSWQFLSRGSGTIVEIGCNDGVLLKPLADQGWKNTVGVDPAANIVNTINDPRISIYNEFFDQNTADQITQEIGRADVIVANNVFAHIPDIVGISSAIKNLLNKDGVFIFEVHYLGSIIQETQYDMIYHEHIFYHSLIALINHFDRLDMEVFDVKPIPIHGGSVRYYVRRKGELPQIETSGRVAVMRTQELKNGYDRVETFSAFGSDVAKRKDKLMEILGRLRSQGRRVAGYGASGRANTIIQYCDIDESHVQYMIDDAPSKWGYWTPGSHLEIFSNDILMKESPDYLLVFAWTYFREIVEKNAAYLGTGGRMITPLPEVHILYEPNVNDAL